MHLPRAVIKNVTFLLSLVGNFEIAAPLVRLMKRRYPLYAGPDSELCIEGFPRSGNSFFVTAFQHWNPGLSIAHHTHLAGSVKYAAHRGLPTVVLLRAPQDAVASVIAWDGLLTVTAGLLAYRSYYGSLRNRLQDVLVLEFDEVTQRPHEAVRKINQRFATSYRHAALGYGEENSIRDILGQADYKMGRGGTSASLPNGQKSEARVGLKQQILRHSLFAGAKRLHQYYQLHAASARVGLRPEAR